MARCDLCRMSREAVLRIVLTWLAESWRRRPEPMVGTVNATDTKLVKTTATLVRYRS